MVSGRRDDSGNSGSSRRHGRGNYQLTGADRDRNITVKVTLSKLNFVTAGNATTNPLSETVPINYSVENGGTIDISPNFVEVGYTLYPEIEPYYTYDNGNVLPGRTSGCATASSSRVRPWTTTKSWVRPT